MQNSCKVLSETCPVHNVALTTWLSKLGVAFVAYVLAGANETHQASNVIFSEDFSYMTQRAPICGVANERYERSLFLRDAS